MRREEKDSIIEDLKQRLNDAKHFYLTDISNLNAEQTSSLRRKCFEKDINRAWMRTDFRGILCPACRTNENLALAGDDLQFIRWTEKHAPRDLDVWKEKIDNAKLIRTFKQKIEHHGELSLKTSQYLSEFR